MAKIIETLKTDSKLLENRIFFNNTNNAQYTLADIDNYEITKLLQTDLNSNLYFHFKEKNEYILLDDFKKVIKNIYPEATFLNKYVNYTPINKPTDIDYNKPRIPYHESNDEENYSNVIYDYSNLIRNGSYYCFLHGDIYENNLLLRFRYTEKNINGKIVFILADNYFNLDIPYTYELNDSKYRDFILKIREKIKNYDELKSSVGYIIKSRFNFEIKQIDLKPMIIDDLDEFYEPHKLENGKEISFSNMHKYVVHSLKYDTSGIYLFNGSPGTGKSTYIQYLITMLPHIKFVTISESILNSIDNPEFKEFWIEDCKNTVLILEDAEFALMNRENNSKSSLVSSILNLGDGILSKSLNIKIIATYNTESTNIDEALIRKGRMLIQHDFKKLSVQRANNLSQKFNLNHTFTNETPVSEIFFKDRQLSMDATKKLVGFKI